MFIKRKNKFKNFIFLFTLFLFFGSKISSQDMTAVELYKSCKNYHDWITSKFNTPVDEQLLFNMGKCQGVIETTGKMMLTLCKESKRNVNISKQLSANLEGIKSFQIIDFLVQEATNMTNLQKYNGQFFLMQLIRKRWPC